MRSPERAKQSPYESSFEVSLTMRGRLRAVLAACSLSFLVALASPQSRQSPTGEPYVIDSFHATIDIAKNGNVRVLEEIRVSFYESRRGIFRVIPTSYDTGGPTRRDILLTDVRVTDDAGNKLTTLVTREGANLKIRIGDEDVWLSPGTQKSYLISYRTENVLNFFGPNAGDWGDTAEFYWNVTGDEWDTTILRSGFTVHYPDVPSDKPIRGRVFAGPYGSTANDIVAGRTTRRLGDVTLVEVSLSDDEFSGERRWPLSSYSGLTLVLALPKGVIAEPTLAQRLRWLLLPNLGLTIPVWVFLGMFFLWLKHGRDEKSGPIATSFDPPSGLGPAECGALIDERVDRRDLSAGIISLATKGYLIVESTETGMFFKRQEAELKFTDKKPELDLTPFESLLLAKLMTCGDVVTKLDLQTKVAPQIGELRQEIYETLVDRGFYVRSPENVRVGWMTVGVLGIVALALLAAWIAPVWNLWPGAIGGVVALPILYSFSRQMPRRLPLGNRTRDQVLGLSEFIARAHRNEMNWMAEKHPDQALFERLLPYAISFGLVYHWGQTFQDIVKQAPSWYRGAYAGQFNATMFASDLSDMGESLAASASTPPRSSGASGGGSGFSSGGGFSGGGFGGGGGGSW